MRQSGTLAPSRSLLAARLFCGLAACLLLISCSRKPPALLPPEQLGKLVVAIRSGPTSFYINPENVYAGIEYELVTRFAQQMHLKAEFIVVADAEEARAKLDGGLVHFAALGLPVAADMPGIAATAYQKVRPVIVVNADQKAPRRLQDLAGRMLYVQSGTAYADHARSLQQQMPELQVQQVDGRDIEELLEFVALGQADAVLTGELELILARQAYPSLAAAMYLTPAAELGWQLQQNVAPRLQAQVRLFFQNMLHNGMMRQLSERYYGHVMRLARPDVEGFLLRRVRSMPRLRPLFQQAEVRTGIDWRLLAALAYQESHWDSSAISPAGARGMMMLTAGTADMLKVGNRHDAAMSIEAGANYLQMLRNTLDRDIAEPDRTWIALAAYNVGLAHVLDARELARRQGRNPNLWVDLREMLPLLQQPRYYRTLKYGYARGVEPVRYTDSVRTYYDILVRFEDQHIPLFPASDARIMVENPEQLRLEVDAALESDGRQTLSRRMPAATGPALDIAGP